MDGSQGLKEHIAQVSVVWLGLLFLFFFQAILHLGLSRLSLFHSRTQAADSMRPHNHFATQPKATALTMNCPATGFRFFHRSGTGVVMTLSANRIKNLFSCQVLLDCYV